MTKQNPIEHLHPLISVQELAEYLDVPVQRIYDWRKAGTGPRGFRFGRELRFRVSDVEHWLDEQAESPEGR
ncbi:MAG: helix-turn-helix transcriptional regulator [Brachybacterium sp.]|uniref:helix-turn-helix transcriptional regulator n=1 Tax=Microbacterium sp. TaxID=51671 RepID=UPI003F9757E0